MKKIISSFDPIRRSLTQSILSSYTESSLKYNNLTYMPFNFYFEKGPTDLTINFKT
jgi:hypothetical protein